MPKEEALDLKGVFGEASRNWAKKWACGEFLCALHVGALPPSLVPSDSPGGIWTKKKYARALGGEERDLNVSFCTKGGGEFDRFVQKF